jgi:hypothetical protein
MRTLSDLIEKIKGEMDPSKVGMIACHNGIVREPPEEARQGTLCPLCSSDKMSIFPLLSTSCSGRSFSLWELLLRVTSWIHRVQTLQI